MDFDLDAYRWKSRILLIFAPSADSKAYKQQTREFEGQKDGILDRDLIILELLEIRETRAGTKPLSERVARQMRRQFDVGAGEFVLILIGKDGTVKLRSNQPVVISKLFGLIDAMPMRQQEMLKKKKPSG
jgi:hypothetical protein